MGLFEKMTGLTPGTIRPSHGACLSGQARPLNGPATQTSLRASSLTLQLARARMLRLHRSKRGRTPPLWRLGAWEASKEAKRELRSFRLSGVARLLAWPPERGTARRRNFAEYALHKDEFPPLLQPGLHKMSVDALKILTVDAFPKSTRRPQLWASFLGVVAALKKRGLTCEIWVDGSFLTKKIDPDDVDFVMDFPIHAIEQATPAQEALLDALGAFTFHKSGKLHSYIMFTAPAVHLQYQQSKDLHDQWRNDFGLSYVKKEPKGIAVVEVQP